MDPAVDRGLRNQWSGNTGLNVTVKKTGFRGPQLADGIGFAQLGVGKKTFSSGGMPKAPRGRRY